MIYVLKLSKYLEMCCRVIKSEELEGTYVDLKAFPPNKSVLKIVSEPAKVTSYSIPTCVVK